MKRVLRLFFGLFLVVFLTGCLAKTHTIPVYQEAQIDAKKLKVVKHLEIEKKWAYWYAVWGLVSIKEPDARQLIKDELVNYPGCKVVNLEIHTETSAVNGLVSLLANGITYGIVGLIWYPQMISIEGDIVK